MIALEQYILKLSISLSVAYLFYILVLRRLTFYAWNRWYLLGYSLIAFLIPFINVSPVLRESTFNESKVLQFIPIIGIYAPVVTHAVANENIRHFTLYDGAFILLLAGICCLLIRLLVQYISYRRLLRSSTLLLSAPIKVYQVNRDIIPFSFGNAVFINQQQHSNSELETIIRHEFIHVKQKHTVDILWAEILCILNWYNPFAWLIRKAIRQNLEFIADHKVISSGADKKQYQYLLLQVIGSPGFSIGPQFNFSALKKRIAMMNKGKTARIHLIRFLFILPLLAVLIVSFREKISTILFPGTPAGEQVLLLPHDVLVPVENSLDPSEKAGLQILSATGASVHLSTTNLASYPWDTVPKVQVTRPQGDSLTVIDASERGENWFNGDKLRKIAHGDPLFVVDGSIINNPKNYLSSINPNDIWAINILKDEKSDEAFGEKGKYGIVEIMTKQGMRNFRGLVILDGVEIQGGMDRILSFSADQIKSADFLVGKQLDAYGERGKQGVLIVTTRLEPLAPTHANDTLPPSTSQAINEMDSTLRFLETFTGLIIVDDKEYDASGYKQLQLRVNDIEIVYIIKPPDAVLRYGAKGKNDVVKIVTKAHKHSLTEELKRGG